MAKKYLVQFIGTAQTRATHRYKFTKVKPFDVVFEEDIEYYQDNNDFLIVQEIKDVLEEVEEDLDIEEENEEEEEDLDIKDDEDLPDSLEETEEQIAEKKKKVKK